MNHDNPDLPDTPVLGERYEISSRLREEPWGDVWLARDRLLKEEVGLKVLPREAPEWSAAQRYYEQEAGLALRLRHPDILGVFHLERTANCLFLVQEAFGGESLLAQFARQQRFSLPQALHLLEKISLALAFAHPQGGVHHALNPLNILLKGEEVRVANFAFPGEDGGRVITLELKAYDAPEVIYGDVPTTASNVFSLGVLGFRLVAGSLPYALTFDEPFPYRPEALPADLGEIPLPLQNLLLRCLSVDPEERFHDVATFLGQLRQVRELKNGSRQAEYETWGPEKPRPVWKAAVAGAGAFLGKFWQLCQPLAQRLKETALRAGSAFLASPRLQLWSLGLVALAVVLIVVGIRLNPDTVEVPKPAPVAAVKPPEVAGGGPPLTETEEPAAPREQPGLRPAPGPALPPAAARTPAATPEARAKEERFMLVAGTYATQKQAQALQQQLKKSNFKARIVSRTTAGKTQYQVQLGPVAGVKAAEDLAGRLKSKEKITPRIMKMTAKTNTAATPARRPAR